MGSGAGGAAGGAEGGKEAGDKLAQVWLEYEYVLKTSLDTQRAHFEEQLDKERRAADAKLEALLADRGEAQVAAARAERERKSQEKAAGKLQEKLAKAQKEADVMRQLNEALLTNQREWEKKLKDLEARHAAAETEARGKVAELEEQVRDLMFFIDAQKKLASEGASEEELATAQVSVSPATPPRLKPSPRRRGKK